MYIYIYATYRRICMMYMHVCVCAACVRAARVRAWPSAGEMGIRIRRIWISAPDAHPERKSKFSGCGFPSGHVGLDSERK